MAKVRFHTCFGVTLAMLFWAGKLSSVSTNSPGQRSGYNETCNKTMKCKSQSWFTCDVDTGTCQCAKRDEMMFDANKGKCLALVGERCKFGFEEEAANTWYEKAECVSGAVCSPSGVCVCPLGTYGDAEKVSCQPVKVYGKSCSSNAECNKNKMLSCVNGTCGCDPDIAIYNPTSYSGHDSSYPYGLSVQSNICVRRVGTYCSWRESKFCVWNAECSNNVCQCRSSYSKTSTKLCGLGHQETCSSKASVETSSGSVCSDNFICSGKPTTGYENGEWDTRSKCSCPNPNHQDYDTVSKSCRGRVGSPCDPELPNACTNKASCIERDNVFQCECNGGYVVTERRKCQLGFGSPCGYTGSNRVKGEETCDIATSLDCIFGRCSCPNVVDIYEDDKRRCATPVGLACQETLECVTNAICKDNPGGKKFPGRCVCSSGFQVGESQTCEAEVISQEEMVTTLEPEGDSYGNNETFVEQELSSHGTCLSLSVPTGSCHISN